MAANVRKYVRRTLSVARDEKRHAEAVMGKDMAILRKKHRRRHDQRDFFEHSALLGVEALRVRIDARIELDDLGPHRCLAAGQGIGKGALAVGRPKDGCGGVHVRLVPSPPGLCKSHRSPPVQPRRAC
jgi:hypothetical protein